MERPAALVEGAEDAMEDVGDEGSDGVEEGVLGAFEDDRAAALEVASRHVFGGDDEPAGEIEVAREAAESDADAAFAGLSDGVVLGRDDDGAGVVNEARWLRRQEVRVTCLVRRELLLFAGRWRRT